MIEMLAVKAGAPADSLLVLQDMGMVEVPVEDVPEPAPPAAPEPAAAEVQPVVAAAAEQPSPVAAPPAVSIAPVIVEPANNSAPAPAPVPAPAPGAGAPRDMRNWLGAPPMVDTRPLGAAAAAPAPKAVPSPATQAPVSQPVPKTPTGAAMPGAPSLETTQSSAMPEWPSDSILNRDVMDLMPKVTVVPLQKDIALEQAREHLISALRRDAPQEGAMLMVKISRTYTRPGLIALLAEIEAKLAPNTSPADAADTVAFARFLIEPDPPVPPVEQG
ncbi:MAG TPA: hypothetical protein VFK82_05850 [Burkholderiaceae bacterium]|nr:hypothetical protein [Burkholderiaceae bacterium]